MLLNSIKKCLHRRFVTKRSLMKWILILICLVIFIILLIKYRAYRAAFNLEPDSAIPEQYRKKSKTAKVILLYFGKYIWLSGTGEFHDCPYSDCFLSSDHANLNSADMVLFLQRNVYSPSTKPPHQIWTVFFHESPMAMNVQPTQIDWTITYMRNSTIFSPYFGNPHSEKSLTPYLPEMFKKSKMVAWLVSNCRASNYRYEYVVELGKYIEVDIYGECSGKMICPKDPSGRNYYCVNDVLSQYHFYIAFENSNCRDYITEKVDHAFKADLVPIVMGAHPDDYRDLLPPNSYIHVDDFKTPRDLSKYLQYLVTDRFAYLKFFHWKSIGHRPVYQPENIWCNLCKKLHQKDFKMTPRQKSASRVNIAEWWSTQKQCVPDRWYSNANLLDSPTPTLTLFLSISFISLCFV